MNDDNQLGLGGVAAGVGLISADGPKVCSHDCKGCDNQTIEGQSEAHVF